MTATSHDFTKAQRTLASAFAKASSERNKRERFDETTGELGWVLHERSVLLSEVNTIRQGHGLAPVTAGDIESIESTAKGHIDYAGKLTLRCAELAVGFRG